MSAKKVLLVSLVKTKAVLGAATRTAAGLPEIDELVGDGLMVRETGGDNGVPVPPEELKVTETDFNEGVFREPLTYSLDASGMLVATSDSISDITAPAGKVKVVFLAAAAADDKAVLVIIETGSGQAPLKFFGKTIAGSTSVDIPVSGVPMGSRVTFASADGYASFCKSVTF
jgi:hypothetical protein